MPRPSSVLLSFFGETPVGRQIDTQADSKKGRRKKGRQKNSDSRQTDEQTSSPSLSLSLTDRQTVLLAAESSISVSTLEPAALPFLLCVFLLCCPHSVIPDQVLL